MKESVEIVEVDAHINDDEFAKRVIDTYDKMTGRGGI